MKTIVSNILVVLIALVIYSCDKVEHPLVKTTTAVGSTFDTVTNASVAGFKKVMLEDYTGHKCGNCPAAAVLAETLKDKYKDTLIVIAVHAGFFAKTNTLFPDTFNTVAGDDWDGVAGFNVSGTGNPNGMVNRKAYPGFTLVHKDTWATTVALGKKDPFNVKLELKSMYDKSARALNVESKITFLAPFSNNMKLTLILTEDSIIGAQLDYSKNPDHVDDYEFDHLLRGAINGSWGELVKAAPIAANSSVTILNNNFAVSSKFNDRHLYLTAFVSNETTKEVYQVERVKIRK